MARRLTCFPSSIIVAGATAADWKFLGYRRGNSFAAQQTIHPGEECEIFARAELVKRFDARETTDFEFAADLSAIRLRFDVYGTNQERQTFEANISTIGEVTGRSDFTTEVGVDARPLER